jgi:hypothetical protein
VKRLAAPARVVVAAGATTAIAFAVAGTACDGPAPPSPFAQGGGIITGPGSGGGGAGGAGGGSDVDPTLGGPCTVDEQCDDQVDCTFDGCDETILRCRFLPDDSQCQNELFCDGVEVCHQTLGCVLGAPVTCTDGNPCTIDTCVEATGQCLQEPRDVDQDGDPDDHCGGGDCNDADPKVSSLEDEVCANGKDDDCDDDLDEIACTDPQNDTCLDPLELLAPGNYALSTAAAELHYSASCGVQNAALARDVVAAVHVPAGPVDVQLTAKTDLVDVAAALVGQCAQPGTEIACSPGYLHPDGGGVAKLRARSLPGNATLPAYVFTEGGSNVVLHYEVLPPSTAPTNETCGTAEPLLPSTPVLASIVGSAVDLGIGCGAATGELVYQFDLAADADVDLYASSIDGDGLPVLSLRGAGCALPADEITCNAAAAAHVFRHSLAAGTYYVAVAGTAPTEAIVTLELGPPTPPPADESCVGAPPLVPNQTIDVDLAAHQDDHDTGCVQGGVDAAYTLDLAVASDVLLVARYSQGDAAAVELALPDCEDAATLLVCATSTISPAHGRKRNLAAGSYRVLVESPQGQPMQLTAFTRPAVPTTVVPFANACNDVLTIPPSGGFFQGNTQNAQADFDAGCDQGGQPSGGASDQLLKIVLAQEKRVVLDMLGSGYATLLAVRTGSQCPGSTVMGGCAAGYYAERSFLDLDLDPGTYYIQVDGYAGSTGPWFLDVHVVDP